MTRSIVVDYDLAGSPAKIWRTLTEPALLSQWLMENEGFKPEVGARFMFRAAPMPPHWDGVVHCEVLAVVPREKLAYSWESRGGFGLQSTVTWTLAPSPTGGTKLRLEHAGFPDGFPGYDPMSRGWQDKGAKLDELAVGL